MSRIAAWLFPTFPPLNERAARWLASELALPRPAKLTGNYCRGNAFPPDRWNPFCMAHFHPEDERHADLMATIDRAARTVSHALAEGFGLIARQITAATPGPDNSAQIEATVQNIKVLIDNLHKSIPKP